MAAYLRTVALLVAIGGFVLCGGFLQQAVGDEEYRRARMARDRNPGNILFESEYRIAEGKRIFLFYSAAGSFLTALIGGSLLWGVGSLHSRVRSGVEEISEQFREASGRGDTWS